MAGLPKIVGRAILGGCLLPMVAMGAPQTIPSTGFVGPKANLGEVLDVGAADVNAVRVYNKSSDGYLGTHLKQTDSRGFVPVDALSRIHAPPGDYFFQTATADGDVGKWRAFDLAGSANGETSIIRVDLGAFPANQSIALSEVIDTNGLPSGAKVEVFFNGDYLGSMPPSKLAHRRITTPEPDANVDVRLNARLPGGAASGRNLTHVEVAEQSDVSVAWNRPDMRINGAPLRPSDIARYELAYSTEPDELDKTLETKNTSVTVEGLETGKHYYFAVRVFDVDGRASWFSKMVVKTAN